MDLIKEWFIIAIGNKTLLQIFIEMQLPIFSLCSVWLATSPIPTIKGIGFKCGVLSQFFWFYTAYQAHNLGLLITCICFTVLWIYRVCTHHDKNSKQAPE